MPLPRIEWSWRHWARTRCVQMFPFFSFLNFSEVNFILNATNIDFTKVTTQKKIEQGQNMIFLIMTYIVRFLKVFFCSEICDKYFIDNIPTWLKYFGTLMWRPSPLVAQQLKFCWFSASKSAAKAKILVSASHRVAMVTARVSRALRVPIFLEKDANCGNNFTDFSSKCSLFFEVICLYVRR